MRKIVDSPFVFVSILAMMLCAHWAAAQVETTTGSIQGDVSDATGAVMPGAMVEVKNIDTNAVRTSTTGDFGHFEFLALQPGNYELTVRKEGFATVVEKEISLTVGRAISLRIAMRA